MGNLGVRDLQPGHRQDTLAWEVPSGGGGDACIQHRVSALVRRRWSPNFPFCDLSPRWTGGWSILANFGRTMKPASDSLSRLPSRHTWRSSTGSTEASPSGAPPVCGVGRREGQGHRLSSEEYSNGDEGSEGESGGNDGDSIYDNDNIFNDPDDSTKSNPWSWSIQSRVKNYRRIIGDRLKLVRFIG